MDSFSLVNYSSPVDVDNVDSQAFSVIDEGQHRLYCLDLILYFLSDLILYLLSWFNPVIAIYRKSSGEAKASGESCSQHHQDSGHHPASQGVPGQ